MHTDCPTQCTMNRKVDVEGPNRQRTPVGYGRRKSLEDVNKAKNLVGRRKS